MVITQRVIDELNSGNGVQKKNRIATGLNTSIHSLERWLRRNKDNGPLTTVAAVQLIQSETGYGESEILEEAAVNSTN